MILHIDIEWVLRSWWFILPVGKTSPYDFARLIEKHGNTEEVKVRFSIHVLENIPTRTEFIRQYGDRISIAYN